MNSDFSFEYEYVSSPDEEERLSQAWDIIFALILEDYENELREIKESEDSK